MGLANSTCVLVDIPLGWANATVLLTCTALAMQACAAARD